MSKYLCNSKDGGGSGARKREYGGEAGKKTPDEIVGYYDGNVIHSRAEIIN